LAVNRGATFARAGQFLEIGDLIFMTFAMMAFSPV
jgi:hypothetical protein